MAFRSGYGTVLSSSLVKKIRVTCIQLSAGADWRKNFKHLTQSLIPQALIQKPELIALPEMFLFRGASGRMKELAGEATPLILAQLQTFAKKHQIAFLAGSLPEVIPGSRKYYNTSFFINEKGRILSSYRKIHLFDIDLKGKVSLQESRSVKGGDQVVSFNWRGIKWGFSICYDLRFSELYRQLAQQGCRAIFVPANFTYETGKAHWQVLLRARAIENQMYIIAPGQAGKNPDTGVRSFGRSMIVNPWGDILAQAGGARETVITSELDFLLQDQLKSQFPVLKHRKL